jgi:hypothetical protein
MKALILRIIGIALKVICFALALGWLALIVASQSTCSILPSVGHQCHGPELDVWMLPFFFAIIGLPTLIASITIIVGLMRRRPARTE